MLDGRAEYCIAFKDGTLLILEDENLDGQGFFALTPSKVVAKEDSASKQNNLDVSTKNEESEQVNNHADQKKKGRTIPIRNSAEGSVHHV